jgi:uncharacterized glyoxalase superfamily protein PhnB
MMIERLTSMMKEESQFTPVIIVSNVDKMCDFYHKAFGFTAAFFMPDESGKHIGAFMIYKNAKIILREEGTFDLEEKIPAKGVPCPINVIIPCEDTDKQFEVAKMAGAEVVFAPKDMPWGSRLCKVRDPLGYIWYLETLQDNFSFSNVPVA